MHLDFVKVRLQRNRRAKTEIVRFGASLFRKTAEVRLRVEHAEFAAADVPGIRNVNRPNVDVLLLGARDGGVEIGIDGIEAPAEIIDTRGEQHDGFTLSGVGPTLDPVLEGEIRAGERTGIA